MPTPSQYRVARLFGSVWENTVHDGDTDEPTTFASLEDAKEEYQDAMDAEAELHGEDGEPEGLRIEVATENGWEALSAEVCDECRSHGPAANCGCYRGEQ